MELKGLLLFAAVWFVVGLIGRAGKKGTGTQRPRQPQPPRPLPRSFGTDPTQQEGSRLELVLRQVQRALEEADDAQFPQRQKEVLGRRYEQSEEGRSLEAEPEVASMETGFSRPGRKRVDQDDQAEEIESRRVKAAAARDVARSPADRTKFDERIRKEPAEHTAARGYTAKQLRDAMVWREILAPPVSLRPESEPDSWS
jgi:hypothetical protein